MNQGQSAWHPLPIGWGEGRGEGLFAGFNPMLQSRRTFPGSLSFLLALTTVSLWCGCDRSPPLGSNEPKPASSTQADATQPTPVTTKSGIEMVCLPGGEFNMGSAQGNPDERPPHPVKVSAFLMDKFEVTHELFKAAQLPNPSRWQDSPKKPVERVRWRDAKQYCNERSLLEGLQPCYNEKTLDWDCDSAANGYRLPTEAEWEYADRAGGEGPETSPSEKLRPFAWFADNADQKTHPVGQKKPNRWGPLRPRRQRLRVVRGRL